MPARGKHREPIVDAAVKLFRRQGYSATGLNEIVEESGAPKGSLYYYFPDGKQAIAVAAIEEAGLRIAKSLETLSARSNSTGDLLKAHAAQLTGWMRKSGFRDGCPITTVLLELAPANRKVCEAGRRAWEKRIAVLRRRLEDDGFDVEAAHRLSVVCTCAMQGALIQARLDRSGGPLELAASELERLIGSDLERLKNESPDS